MVLRQLPAVIGFDALVREAQRRERIAVSLCIGGIDLSDADAERPRVELDAIKLLGEFDERRIAARNDVCHDRADGGFDVLRSFTFGAEKRVEPRAKIGAARIKPNRHWSMGPALPCVRWS